MLQLCRNGIEAIEGEGRLRVQTRNVTAPGPDAPPDLPPGHYVALLVQDSGCGMDAETLSHAFEPFFTTKFQGRGLGLSATYGIVKNHGGQIISTSEGTTIRVYLPARCSWPAVEADKEQAPAHGRETLLVVDCEDEAVARLQAGLPALGYDVRVARDIDEAGAALADPRIALVLWDPASTGGAQMEFVRALHAARPELPVLVACHPGMAHAALRLLPVGVRDFITKPLEIPSLALLLGKHLESSSGR